MNKMEQILLTTELFSATGSFSKVADKLGHSIITIDNDPQFNPTFCLDILDMNLLPEGSNDIIWASPPCQTFSVASIGTHWTGGHRAYVPKTDKARLGLKILDKTINIIAHAKPKYWFIENPRGVMRKIIESIFKKYNVDFVRKTVTYCQYGDTRMKPTDIWTNLKIWDTKPMCKNGDKCHISAPRGAKTGTQGLKNAIDRSRIPATLFLEIFKYIQLSEVIK